MQTILTDAPALPDESTTAAAVTFRTRVPDLATLSDAKRALLSEWLDRASGGDDPGRGSAAWRDPGA